MSLIGQRASIERRLAEPETDETQARQLWEAHAALEETLYLLEFRHQTNVISENS